MTKKKTETIYTLSKYTLCYDSEKDRPQLIRSALDGVERCVGASIYGTHIVERDSVEIIENPIPVKKSKKKGKAK